jgi:hypothetical protein
MTGEEKVRHTLKAFTEVSEDADAMQLTLASVAMGLESQAGFLDSMGANQESGELDEFVLALTRWIATHRSDDAEQLLVVEIPVGQNIPPGTRLHRLDLAAEAMATAESPL